MQNSWLVGSQKFNNVFNNSGYTVPIQRQFIPKSQNVYVGVKQKKVMG